MAWMDILQCAYCGGPFQATRATQSDPHPQYDILNCHCSRYPVVAGIPILKKGAIGYAEATPDDVVHLIEDGKDREALVCMLLPPFSSSPRLAPIWIQHLPSVKGMGRLQALAHRRALTKWRQHIATILLDEHKTRSAFDLFPLLFQRGVYYFYFAYRFGQPRHLAALSLTSIIHDPKKPLLDLACGVGHLTGTLTRRAGKQIAIGVDRAFVCLYMAKHWMAPEAHYVCCDADGALPFSGGAFSAVLCSDVVHDLSHKISVIRELQRLTQDDGVILLASMRNALVKQIDRFPSLLSPDGYRQLIAGMPHALLPNSIIVSRYLQRLGPPLGAPPSGPKLGAASLLSMVVAYNDAVLHDYGRFAEWPHAEEGRLLRVNPLYVEVEKTGIGTGKKTLRRTFPSPQYEEENADCKEYLPETVELSTEVFNDLAMHRRSSEVERLIERCVVLGMPRRYINNEPLTATQSEASGAFFRSAS